MRYLLTFSYDGKDFSGYQKQEGLRTVQEEMERALEFINGGKKTPLTSSGRTDKGVHALHQMGHVDIFVDITEYKLKRALNSNLPEDIHVIDAKKVSNDFHARYMVKEKEYKYFLNMGEYEPTKRNYVYQYCKSLNVDAMLLASKYFLGVHDFDSFTPTKDKKDNCVREIFDIKIEKYGDIIVFTFRGNGFLKYQIRNMVGYLIRVGEGKKKASDIPQILKSKDRRMASITAHPEGLYLTDVVY